MMRISGSFGDQPSLVGKYLRLRSCNSPITIFSVIWGAWPSAGGPSYAILVCQRRLAQPIFSIPKLKGWERSNLIDLPVAGLLKGCNILKLHFERIFSFFGVLQAATGIIAPMTSFPHPGENSASQYAETCGYSYGWFPSLQTASNFSVEGFSEAPCDPFLRKTGLHFLLMMPDFALTCVSCNSRVKHTHTQLISDSYVILE